MALETTVKLPDYDTFSDVISALKLPLSSSRLHGMMCGYLSAGALKDGESYVRALLSHHHDDETRDAARALFSLFTITEQQMTQSNYEFELFIPQEHEPLAKRAKGFSEWCDGYTQGLVMLGIEQSEFDDEETREAIQHLLEFATLDYETVDVSEEDEQAFMEVCEYARVAVMHIYTDFQMNLVHTAHPDHTH